MFVRNPNNPIITAGKWDWRMCSSYNPAAIFDNDKFYILERASNALRPHTCCIGLLSSDDGVNFSHVSNEPVFMPSMLGYPHGSIQDPRVVKIEGVFYMTFAFRRFAWNIYPTGLGAPDASQPTVEAFDETKDSNQTRSGIAKSTDLLTWEFVAWTTPEEIDDRNNILFPEKIGGKFALLRRPITHVATDTGHSEDHPSVQISFSEDLKTWSEPRVVIEPQFKWEDNRIGGSTPPIKTDRGWLTFYHGVENTNSGTRRVIYRMGVMLLDLHDPTKVIARCPDFVMEPEEYYEKFGLFIPNVIFPTGAVLKDDLIWLYYGCCDTSIGLATVPLAELMDVLPSS